MTSKTLNSIERGLVVERPIVVVSNEISGAGKHAEPSSTSLENKGNTRERCIHTGISRHISRSWQRRKSHPTPVVSMIAQIGSQVHLYVK